MEEINNGFGILKDSGYSRRDIWDDEKTNKLAEHYKEILKLLGEDVDREGLTDTPIRVAKSIQFLNKGNSIDPHEIIRSAMFREDYREMVIVKDIELYSLCEHHMIPFYGKAHVGYIPDKYITGLS
ncbi:MAG: GTP cyclohydrolase I, partial [Bacteroidia bacterium]